MVVYTTLLLQAVGGLLTAVVFYSFYRHLLRSYLLLWAWSWTALSVHMMVSGAAVYVVQATALAASHPLRVALASVSGAAAYMQVALLLFGVYEMTTGRIVARQLIRRVLLTLALLAGVIALLSSLATLPSELRFGLRVGIRFFVAGLAFLIAARGVWNAHGRRGGVGPRVVTGAFFLYGLEQLHLFGATVLLPLAGRASGYAQFLGFFDFLLQIAIALGLIIWLLEDERRATEQAAAQIEHLAYHDPLTGLPNRQLFLDRLHLAIANAHRAGHRLAVLFLDLDRFKVINDSLGHGSGDGLLRGVASRIQELLRANDTVARLGGDEFTILAPQIFDADDAIALARKLREAMRMPFTVDGRELFASASVGISLYPDDGADPETLLKNADIAMYRAKGEGRDTFQLYTPAMNARALEQLALENSLRRAVITGELLLHFQPIVHLESGRVHGVESLVRWRHPELGLLAPDRFIFLAEATGLIVPVGEWVLRAACTQVREWQLSGHPTLRAAVNLSARQLQQPDFVRRVTEIVAETGLAFDTLEFEVTESVAMHRHDGMIERVRELKALGVHISVDDFGTGYSSLSALQLLPVDSVKIDRSFVQELMAGGANAGVARAVISLGHSLGLRVIAEGIETESQLTALRELGCEAGQGYYFGHPMDGERCRALLDQKRDAGFVVAPRAPARAGKSVRR